MTLRVLATEIFPHVENRMPISEFQINAAAITKKNQTTATYLLAGVLDLDRAWEPDLMLQKERHD